ncbi:MAG: 4'-phosphopantetheinyl transferase [Linnemannia elongata]|nr:MAG: 4'-phosphopantetheinyl transferase [Linnemannia elongata]
MGILGIGIDILHLPRLKQVLSRRPDRFLTRVLTKAELTDFEQLKTEIHGKVAHDRAVRFVGVRWALKEATYKAMTPRHKLTWQDVTVYKDQGKPCLHIPEKEKFGIGAAHCSVSHDGEYLVAQVVFESPEPPH